MTAFTLAMLAGIACSSYDAVPPPGPAGPHSSDDTTKTFAIDAIMLGDSIVVDDNPNGSAPSTTAWQSFGYNLDGKSTDKTSADVCTRTPGAPSAVQVDGIGGRDNAFGSCVLPIINTLTLPNPLQGCDPTCPALRNLTADATGAIRSGRFTLQLQITGLADETDQTSVALSAQIFTSDRYDDGGAIPTFDSNTDWPVQPESLADPPTLLARAKFTSAYVVNGTVVAGVGEHVTLPLHVVIDAYDFTLLVHEAVLTFDHVSSNEAANGVIAGIIDPDQLVAMLARQVPLVLPTFCGFPFATVRQCADIGVDGTNSAQLPCTGISIGLGFHATRVANPTKVAGAMSTAESCDAGQDG